MLWKRELVALPCVSSWCPMTVIVLCLLLTVSWVGLKCVIVIFPDHTHLLFLGHTGLRKTGRTYELS